MSVQCDCIIGIRQPNYRSGVGLFNKILARRLGIRYYVLPDRPHLTCHPLISLKFDELQQEDWQLLQEGITGEKAWPRLSLFLHTYTGDSREVVCLRRATHIFCGNDAIYEEIKRHTHHGVAIRAFAPGLLPERYYYYCRPSKVQLFYFGMATKVDFGRLRKLQSLLTKARVDYRFLCSLANHQTSDAGIIGSARQKLRELFGIRFVFLGTLHSMGIAYMLNSGVIFVSFYPGGARANNTTLNTAFRYGCQIITNCDPYSPKHIQHNARILNIDIATLADVLHFVKNKSDIDNEDMKSVFRWRGLVSLMRQQWLGVSRRSA